MAPIMHNKCSPAAKTLTPPLIFRLSPEVLRAVFSFLDQGSCSRVARSCKRFKEPALDQLWSNITTLVAPLALLDDLVHGNNGCMFRNGLSRANWPNYSSYADRVRELHVTKTARGGRIELDPNTLVHASAVANSQIGSGALLPKARTLEFDFQQAPGPVLLLHLISPAVRHIIITIPGRFHEAASVVFSTLAAMSCSVKLERFDVTILNDGSRASTSKQGPQSILETNIAKFVASQSGLQRLRIHPIDSLSSLKQAIGPLRHLRALELAFKTSTSNSPLQDIITSLGSCIDLEKLHIQGPLNLGRQNFSVIQPLLSCARLTNLDLSWLGSITLNAANVEEMGKAWTKLESLRFSLVGDKMPVDLLINFAASFSPSLQSLTIPLDVSTVERISPITTYVPSHDLKRLFTGSSLQESHIQPFAELLGAIFRPGFCIISSNGTGGQRGSREPSSSYDRLSSLLSLIWRVQNLTRHKVQNELGACDRA